MNSKQETLIELRSEEVQELLMRPPKWIVRWGVTVIFLVLIIVFTGAWIIHYPDLVRASFRLTSANAPKVALTRTEGKIIRLLIREGKTVKAGDALAYVESTANHDDIIRLSRELAKAWDIAQNGHLEELNRHILFKYRRLGELQNAYQVFEQARIQLQAYLKNGFFDKKKDILYQEISDLKALADNLHEQHKIQEKDMQLAQEDLDIQRQLAKDKVIALLDLKREESKNIAHKLPYQQTASALITNLTAQRVKQKEILELDRQVSEERNKFLQELNTLQSAVDSWKAKYIVTAPVGGRVSFVGTIQENQSVSIMQELFYISPRNTNYFGELRVPQQNAGKVLVGQNVLIKFAGYPYPEYGAVRGRITYIANIPLKDSIFLAKVIIPAGLKTTYNKSLSYRTGMTATADIITTDTRLLEKLFYRFRTFNNY